MADHLVLQVSDGSSHCLIADPTGTPLSAPIVEIGPSGAVIACDAEFEPNAYLDLTLDLKGQPPRKFFAHVVGPEDRGLRIRWMHLDPGEEAKLKGLLAAYSRTVHGGHSGGTRRVIRPKTETITPFQGQPALDAQVPVPGPAAATAVTVEPERKGTRRIVRARPDEHEPTASTKPAGEESRAHPVVIASTAKFEKMESLELTDPAPAGDLAGAGAPAESSEPPSPQAGGSGRMTVVGKDGRMDVGAAIRSKAKTVRASELAARHERVRVLNMSTIKQLIQEAVEEAASHLTRALGEAERKRLMEEAEEGFKERLKAFELDKKSAEEKARELQNQLGAAKELLEQERKRTIAADQFIVSEAGLVEIDGRMAKVVERALSRGEVNPELELKLREMISGILDSEREKMREKELSAHNEKIALLEKKVSRLAHSLDSTEKERDEARKIAEAMEKHGLTIGEVKNKYRIGLDGADPNRERKVQLMKELVEQNRELRRALGMKIIDPAQAAAEAEAEDKRAREETAKAKAEALAEVAAEKDVPPAAEPEAPAPEAEASDEQAPSSAEPEVNPDDLPWEAAPAPAAPKTAADDRGVKILRDYKRFEPPPLQVTDPGAVTDAEADADPVVEIDPDDQPWEPEATSQAEATPASGVKRISVPRKEPPPLDRR